MTDDILERARLTAAGITEGHWTTGGLTKWPVIVYAPDGYAICDTKVYHGRHPAESAAANARFIAAAPDLVRDLIAEVERLQAVADLPLAIGGMPSGHSFDPDAEA